MIGKQEQEEKVTETTPMDPNGQNCGDGSRSIPLIVIENTEGMNVDEPPPYSVIVPPNHVGWPLDFSSCIPYSSCTPCRRESQLAPFQHPFASSGYHPEGNNHPQTHHTSIMMPLMPCQFLKFGSRRSPFGQQSCPFSDTGPASKDFDGKTRRYGALLIGAAVIIFLMALSLLVRFIVEGKFWRG